MIDRKKTEDHAHLIEMNLAELDLYVTLCKILGLWSDYLDEED